MQIITKEIFTIAALLQKVREEYEYEDGKRTDKRVGFVYDVVFPSDDYDGLRLSVKIPTETPVITERDLTKSRTDGQKLFITFEGLTIGNYNNRAGAASFSARAQKAMLTAKDGVPVSAASPAGAKQ